MFSKASTTINARYAISLHHGPARKLNIFIKTVYLLLYIFWQDSELGFQCSYKIWYRFEANHIWNFCNVVLIIFQKFCSNIQPGCPTQNGYIERFNGSYRRAVLDAYIFRTIDEVRMQTEAWRNYYNKERPHESLNNMTPYEYRALKEKDDDWCSDMRR